MTEGTELIERPESAPAVVTEQPGSLLAVVAMLAKDRDFDPVKFDAVLRAQERLEDRQSAVAFNRALAEAQAEIPHIEKNGRVDLGDKKGGYAFTTYEDMDKVLRPIMERHGFTVMFDMAMKEGGGAIITGTLLHREGHSKTASIPLALDSGPGRNNLQAMGSTASYGRRYCLELLFNIVRKNADDDGKLGGTRFITDAQATKLRELLDQTRTAELAFLQLIGFASLENIPDANYAIVQNMLLAKLNRPAKT